MNRHLSFLTWRAAGERQCRDAVWYRSWSFYIGCDSNASPYLLFHGLDDSRVKRLLKQRLQGS
jgi:hypothetical protein